MLLTDILKEEHKHILRIISLLNKASTRLVSGQKVSPKIFERICLLIKEYVDHIHHFKEEEYLFGIIEEAPSPEEAEAPQMLAEISVSQMYTEHDEGRACLKEIIKSVADYKRGEKKALHEIVSNSNRYGNLIQHHIDKEDNELFPLAETLISDNKKREIVKKFMEQDKKLQTYRYLEELVNIESTLETV